VAARNAHIPAYAPLAADRAPCAEPRCNACNQLRSGLCLSEILGPCISFASLTLNDQIYPDNELWINDVMIQTESFEIRTIILEGDGWSLSMKTSDDDFKMKIQDTEIPYLHSQRNKAE
jgi:hypothetical protein